MTPTPQSSGANQRFSDRDIEEVRSRADLITVISSHVSLRREGSLWKGLCPFHDEKSPSFKVNPATNTWTCYGCGEHGDVFTFIQSIEGEGFRWAVEALAEQFGVQLSYETDGTAAEERSLRTRIIEVNEAAAEFFKTQLLTSDDAEAARTLLTDRGFDPAESAARFDCGYAPRGGKNDLVRHLRDQGFKIEDITASGVATHSRGTVQDRFQGRLTWTIRNPLSRAIGFGARRLYEDDHLEAKFINTAETPAYKKSTVLYGYHDARREISKAKRALVVEGYTDVMACHLAGVPIAVAACGTAFTTDHLQTLRRLVGDTGEITFGMDDDPAGRKASLAVYDLARSSIRRLTALPPSNGLDPDEVRQQQGEDRLRELVEGRRPLIERVLIATIENSPLETPEDRRSALDSALPLLNHVTDALMRGEYANLVAERLGYQHAEVLKLVRAPGKDSSSPPDEPASGGSSNPVERSHREVARIMVQHEPTAHAYYDSLIPLVESAPGKKVMQVIRAALDKPREHGDPWSNHVLTIAEALDAKPLVLPLMENGLPVHTDKASIYAGEMLTRARREAVEQVIRDLREAVANATTDEEREAALLDLMEVQAASPHRPLL